MRHRWSIKKSPHTGDFGIRDNGCLRLFISGYGICTTMYQGEDYSVCPSKYAAVSYIYWGALSFFCSVSRRARKVRRFVKNNPVVYVILIWAFLESLIVLAILLG